MFSAVSLIEWNSTNTTDLLGQAGAVFDDLKLLVLLILAIFIGLYIAERIIKAVFFKEEK